MYRHSRRHFNRIRLHRERSGRLRKPGSRASICARGVLALSCGHCRAGFTANYRNRAGFPAIANTSGMTATALRAFLQTPHTKMPNLILTPEQSADVIAFLLSLRDRRPAGSKALEPPLIPGIRRLGSVELSESPTPATGTRPGSAERLDVADQIIDSVRVSDRSGIAPCGCDRKARNCSAVLARAIVGKLGGPCCRVPAGLPPVTWQLAHHCWASWFPLVTSAPAGCAATVGSTNATSITAGSLQCIVVVPSPSEVHPKARAGVRSRDAAPALPPR
jgi:hypothetical protein